MILAVHLLHEAPPDKVAGIGRWLEYITKEHTQNNVKHIAMAMSFINFNNYKGGVIHDNWYRTKPSMNSSNIGFIDELNEQNNRLFDLFINFISKVDVKEDIVIHCHDWLSWIAAKKIKTKYGYPIILTLHTILNARKKLGFLEFPNKESISVALNLQSEAAENSEAVTFFDNESKEISAKYISIKGLLEVLPLGIPIFNNIKEYTKSSNIRIGYLGRLSKEKGIHLLCDTIKLIGSRGVLYLAGIGPLESELIGFLKRNRIKFEYSGYAEDLNTLFSSIDLLFIPSLYDPGPLTAIESLCHQTPVVISNKCGVSQLIKKYDSCVATSNTNPNSFYRSIKEIEKTLDTNKPHFKEIINDLTASKLNINQTKKRLGIIYRYSLIEEQISNNLKMILNSIPNEVDIAAIYLYGSALHKATPHDLDFLVITNKWSELHNVKFEKAMSTKCSSVYTKFGICPQDKDSIHILFIPKSILKDL